VRPPEFGEHTEEILAELGFDKDEIKDLRERKVV
jgi:crotonobetainyl-CoA:carnitine CoA-transferase CaiB-like acyl-CoA transferase